MIKSFLKFLVLGVVLLVACISLTTFLAHVVNNVFLGKELWFVVLLLQGLLFGVPLFFVLFVSLVRRMRRPNIMEGRRRIFEGI